MNNEDEEILGTTASSEYGKLPVNNSESSIKIHGMQVLLILAYCG
jgi:hypothetical protein